VCTVTHLRLSLDLEKSSSFGRSLVHCLNSSSSSSSSSQRTAIQYLALATTSDQMLPPPSSCQQRTSPDVTLTSLLSASLGPHRRKFLRMLSSPDVDRARRDTLAALRASQDVMRHAFAAACSLPDPHLMSVLISWLLREDSGQQGEAVFLEHHAEIERLLMSLPLSVAGDARVRAALGASGCMHRSLMVKLLQVRCGETSLRRAVEGLSVKNAARLVWLHAKWTARLPAAARASAL
jgi:hypothetical protein